MADQSKYASKLNNARVLITGGTSGIGFGVAEGLLEHGAAEVIVASSNPDKVKDTIARLEKSYPSKKGRVTGYAANLGEEGSLESNVVDLLKKATANGKLDHIVHTAGDTLALKPISQCSMADVKQAGMVRYFAAFFISKHAPQYLNAGPASSITLTTGSVSEKPQPNWTMVNGFATGLQGLTRGLALDLKPIRVNLVSPGAVLTELWDRLPAEMRDQRLKGMGEKTTTGEVGKVEDVAETFLYLMKDKNISGSMVSTNGGAFLV